MANRSAGRRRWEQLTRSAGPEPTMPPEYDIDALPEQPDPFPVATLLRAAVAHARRGGASQADIARAAGLTPEALSRALKPGSDARPSTVRAVLRVAGMRLGLEEIGDSGADGG